MSIEKKIPHSSDPQEERSISAPQNLHGNPQRWWVRLDRGCEQVLFALERFNLMMDRFNWSFLKWIIPAIFWYTRREQDLPQDVKSMQSYKSEYNELGYYEQAASLQLQFKKAVDAVLNNEPCSPAMKIILEQSLANSVELLNHFREKQRVIDVEIEQFLQTNPTWENYWAGLPNEEQEMMSELDEPDPNEY